MATVGTNYLDLADLYKRKDENDDIADIIELLAETMPILDDMVVEEANDGTSHLTTMRTGIPGATFRKLYQAVQPTKSTTKQVKDGTAMMESWSEIDAKLVELSGNPGKLRLSEATAFLEGLGQTASRRIFYGNTATDPEEFLGLAPRFSSLAAENGSQIVDAGGTGADNSSIWFVVWAERTVHGLYPKGSKAGIQRDDKGKQTKETQVGVYDVYREKFSWDLGLSVRDWRYVSRIANIDVSDVQSGTVKLYDFMRKAYYRLRQRKITGGRAAIYMNRDMLEALDALATNAGASDNFVRLTRREVEGAEIVSYRGIPIRETDALLNTEARVV